MGPNIPADVSSHEQMTNEPQQETLNTAQLRSENIILQINNFLFHTTLDHEWVSLSFVIIYKDEMPKT